jgi:hypothetical protein
MGIDAEMIAIVKRDPKFSKEEVTDLASRLVDSIGAEHFNLLPPEKYPDLPNGQHALRLVDQYDAGFNDETIKPQDGEQIIRVALYGRYYGPGYERGDLPTIIMVAEWLERNLLLCDCRIHYGGDSSGVCQAPFNRAAREELIEHWATCGRDPYLKGWGDFAKGQGEHVPEPGCSFCNDRPMYACRWGGAFTGCTGWRCSGCLNTANREADGKIKFAWNPKDTF